VAIVIRPVNGVLAASPAPMDSAESIDSSALPGTELIASPLLIDRSTSTTDF